MQGELSKCRDRLGVSEGEAEKKGLKIGENFVCHKILALLLCAKIPPSKSAHFFFVYGRFAWFMLLMPSCYLITPLP